jgi:hypothetical protein
MGIKFVLTVDWCNQGKRGIFCDKKGRAFWKDNEPHTHEEIDEVLGIFEMILAPQSIEITEIEVKEYNWFVPLSEYSDEFGVAIKRPKEISSL